MQGFSEAAQRQAHVARTSPLAPKVKSTPRRQDQNQARRGQASRPRRSDARVCADREATVLRLLPLVRRVAYELRERLPQHVDLEDLAGAGVLGLLEAVRRFDVRRHAKIETYARYRIRGAILDSLREMDPASRDLRRKSKAAENVYRTLQSRLGRPVEDDELASAMGLSLEAWYRSVREINSLGLDWMRPHQFPEPSRTEEPSAPAESGDSAFDICYRREQKDLLAKAASMLPAREREVITLYYGREKTMSEIGRLMQIDESRVSQIHTAAVARLRMKVRRLLTVPPAPAMIATVHAPASVEAHC